MQRCRCRGGAGAEEVQVQRRCRCRGAGAEGKRCRGAEVQRCRGAEGQQCRGAELKRTDSSAEVQRCWAVGEVQQRRWFLCSWFLCCQGQRFSRGFSRQGGAEVQVQVQRRCRDGAEVEQRWSRWGGAEVQQRWFCAGDFAGAEVLQKHSAAVLRFSRGGAEQVQRCRGTEVQRCRGFSNSAEMVLVQVISVQVQTRFCREVHQTWCSRAGAQQVQRCWVGAEVQQRWFLCRSLLLCSYVQVQSSAEVQQRFCRVQSRCTGAEEKGHAQVLIRCRGSAEVVLVFLVIAVCQSDAEVLQRKGSGSRGRGAEQVQSRCRGAEERGAHQVLSGHRSSSAEVVLGSCAGVITVQLSGAEVLQMQGWCSRAGAEVQRNSGAECKGAEE
jgi:hypothetical protein